MSFYKALIVAVNVANGLITFTLYYSLLWFDSYLASLNSM